MSTLRRLLFRMLALVSPGRADAELSREIEAHLRLLEDGFVERGMSRSEARTAARRAFGGRLEQVRLEHRDARAFRWVDEWSLDARLGARMLFKHPGLTVVGVVGMAVAIAVSAAFFAFFYAYLSSTLPVPEGDRIVALENWDIESNNEFRQALHDYHEWRGAMTSLEAIGAFRTTNRNLIVPGGTTEPVRLAEITASGLRLTRVAPRLGRLLVDDDERPGAPPVVIIGESIWQRQFGADPSALGRQIRFGNKQHTIVGVMPEGFQFPVNHHYWVPLATDPSGYRRGTGPAIFIFGRLAQRKSMADAQAELAALGQRSAQAHPATHARLRPRVMPYAHPILDIQGISIVEVASMQAIVSVLLIVVAVNVAILVYARTATRQGEIAVRTALGASRGRIVTQLFVEALVLCAIAAAVGLALTKVGITQGHAIMEAEGAGLPYWIDYGLPVAAIAYVIGLALLAAVIAGIVPALSATSRRVEPTLRLISGAAGRRLGTTWTTLVVGQVAIAVAALPMAVALGWAEVRATTTMPAFAVEQYLAGAFAMDPEPPPGVDAAAFRANLSTRLERLQQDLAARLESESWVADVTVAARPPGQESSRRIEIEGAGGSPRTVYLNQVDVDFFAAFDARLLAGRWLAPADRAVSAATPGSPALVVNRTFAEQVLGGSAAVGRRVRYVAEGSERESRWYEIVGIVSDLHTNPVNPELQRPMAYHSLIPGNTTRSLAIRVAGGDPSSHLARLRELTAAIDPTVRLSAYPLVQVYRQQGLARRLVAGAVAAIVVSVLLLSAAGIYALMSFTVAQRHREIGIRAALGADARRLLRSIFARSASQLAAGIAVGVAAALAIDAAGGGVLGTARLPLLAGMAVAMFAVGLAASIGPARRGLRIQPTEALRAE